ncbi:MAG: hypothetical protein DI585_05905 [Pseudomonas fluorescens]|nr:MAG: hypothetical protein DI585_05905 [Pseudomonas fluorescens]
MRAFCYVTSLAPIMAAILIVSLRFIFPAGELRIQIAFSLMALLIAGCFFLFRWKSREEEFEDDEDDQHTGRIFVSSLLALHILASFYISLPHNSFSYWYIVGMLAAVGLVLTIASFYTLQRQLKDYEWQSVL